MDRKEAYVYAIENEIKSANLYKILEKSFKDDDLAKTFNKLTSLEAIHQDKLIESFTKEYPGKPLIYDDTIMPKINVKRNLTDPQNIIEYAIDREIAMADQYRFMAEESEDDDIKEFFLSLVEEEVNHKDLLETELNRIHGTMIWFDSSELNGLMEY